jgi:hypothetical protein
MAVDHNVGFLDLRTERFEAEIFDITNNADGEDDAVEFLRLLLTILASDLRR